MSTSSPADIAPHIHFPSSGAPSPSHVLSSTHFPYEAFMGDWAVVGSSLPLWKKRSNVVITYHKTERGLPALGEEQVPGKSTLQFEDEINWYEDGKEAAGKAKVTKLRQEGKKNWLRGLNKLDAKATNGATFHWTGLGWLRLLSAHWQVIGASPHFGNASAPADEPIWLVTYFSKSLFTPAGVDIYVRNPSKLSDETYGAIVAALEKLEAKEGATEEEARGFRKAAQGMFRIPYRE
ncbi:hypothetical protein OC834_004094 [Tilletia horrida]|uniref:Uncharacterized protein n=1 Tax=Tilletia horrida TaxID=155126 RepID=A0AAN6G806_9BASI|nr:hypothetical protein OC842_005099 [Tilletia horrida]KAK0528211.1 hypothetical protein OC835_004732 [Tilletia horrida]KAK0528314.1 hypothetical protein OC834_004094 [Tilletia horrida]KAK0563135.1 hypothetical protein OC844_002362 [Tilletia horrida]